MRILLIGCEVIIRELCDAVARSPLVRVPGRVAPGGCSPRYYSIKYFKYLVKKHLWHRCDCGMMTAAFM